MLPWVTLPRHLARSRLALQNYPDGVRFPGEQLGTKKSKGIADLNSTEQDILLKSIRLTTKLRLQVVAVAEFDARGKIQTFW
jgi:hypothetical protein